MSTDNDFPAFDPSMLSREAEQENTKITWQPDREAIEKALEEQKVKLNMPRIFFSSDENEVAQAIGNEYEFRDELIEKYEILHDDETDKIRIHIFPLEDTPFWLKVSSKGLIGPKPKKALYLVEKAEECYKESEDKTDGDDSISNKSTAFRIA